MSEALSPRRPDPTGSVRLLSVIHDLSAATKRAGVSGAADGEVSQVAKGADRKSAAVWGNDTGNKPVSGTASHTSAFKLSAGLNRNGGLNLPAPRLEPVPTAKRRMPWCGILGL